MYPTNPEHEAIVNRINGLLAELPVGGTLPYSAASNAAGGRDIAGRYRYLLEKAREKTEADLGCIFECVRTVGIKRLAPSESPEVGLSAIQRVRKMAKRGKRRLDRLNANSFAEPEQRRVIAYRAMLGAVAMIADGRRAASIAVVADPAKPIPPKNILAMFQTTG